MTTLLCHRCSATLAPGEGSFYVVRIEAFADPTPAPIAAEDLGRNVREEIEAIIASVADRSARELADDVYRSMTVHLCRPCYLKWIENPMGSLEES